MRSSVRTDRTENSDWCGSGFFQGKQRNRESRLRLAPIAIAVRDHDVKHPLMPLFFRFNQSKGIEIEQVVLDKVNLSLCHAASLQIDSDAGKMRRSGVAINRSSIPIVAAQFLLNLDGADGGIYLDLGMKLVVVNFRKVFDEITRPRTTVAPGWIETRMEMQTCAFFDRHQIMRRFELFQFNVIGNPRQIKPVDFLILPNQGIVGRPEHRIPKQASKSAKVQCPPNPMAMDALNCEGVSGRHGHNENRKQEYRSQPPACRPEAVQTARY